MARKYFSNTAVATTLASNISDADTSLTVNSSTGYPAVPFVIAINAGTSAEEIIKVGAKSGTTFSTLTRGYDSTTARAHTSGASVKHVAAAEDFDAMFTHTHATSDGHANIPIANVTGTVPTTKGGTGVTSLGTAGQVLKVNSGANALEYGDVEAVFNIDGMTDGSGITIADADKFPISDGGTEKYVNASQIKTYVGPLDTEQVQDIVGAMFSGNTETNISVTYHDSDGTIDLVSTDTQLTTEAVQDIVGAMFSSNTETRISATYEDGDGTIDLVVDDMTTNTQLTTEEVQDIVGAMLTGNTETRISVTYEDGDGTIDFVVDDMTSLTQEQVEDFVGGMVTGNTETFITVTYEDADGTLDFVVPVKDEDDMASDSDTFLATQQSIKAYVDNASVSSEQVQDIVGAMFTGNTETGITATYEDGDGTIDLVVSASSDVIKDADNDTKIQAEEASDEDKLRYDIAGTEVAVQDVGGMAFTTNSGTVRHHQTQAGTYTIAANEGQVMAGPVTVTGTITNSGTLVII